MADFQEPGINGYTYQHVGFHFNVFFNNQNGQVLDARFQSISGLEFQMETESLKEGGENRFEHVLPVRRKTSDLILKRGLLSPNAASLLTGWCKSTFEDLIIEPYNLIINLLDPEHNPILYWNVEYAWPKSWKFGELNAERSEVLIETLELTYNHLSFESQ